MNEIKKYTTKPCTIEAIEFDGTKESFENIQRQYGVSDDIMFWEQSRFVLTFNTYRPFYKFVKNYTAMYIETLEGTMKVEPGDFIIRGLRGEYYPCKPDVFHMKYREGEQ